MHERKPTEQSASSNKNKKGFLELFRAYLSNNRTPAELHLTKKDKVSPQVLRQHAEHKASVRRAKRRHHHHHHHDTKKVRPAEISSLLPTVTSEEELAPAMQKTVETFLNKNNVVVEDDLSDMGGLKSIPHPEYTKATRPVQKPREEVLVEPEAPKPGFFMSMLAVLAMPLAALFGNKQPVEEGTLKALELAKRMEDNERKAKNMAMRIHQMEKVIEKKAKIEEEQMEQLQQFQTSAAEGASQATVPAEELVQALKEVHAQKSLLTSLLSMWKGMTGTGVVPPVAPTPVDPAHASGTNLHQPSDAATATVAPLSADAVAPDMSRISGVQSNLPVIPGTVEPTKQSKVEVIEIDRPTAPSQISADGRVPTKDGLKIVDRDTKAGIGDASLPAIGTALKAGGAGADAPRVGAPPDAKGRDQLEDSIMKKYKYKDPGEQNLTDLLREFFTFNSSEKKEEKRKAAEKKAMQDAAQFETKLGRAAFNVRRHSGMTEFLGAMRYLGMGKERISVVQNLATMLNAGLPLIDALKTLQMETHSKPSKKLLGRILEAVENGSPLWRAMDDQQFFSPHAIALIRIGEEAGNLAENMQYLADQQEKDMGLKQKVKMAMIYPAIVMVLMFIIVIGLGMFVLPNLIQVLFSLNVKLPLVTRLVIMFTEMFTTYGAVGIPTFIVGCAVLTVVARYTRLKVVAQWIVFRVPGIGKLAREATIARFGVILGSLLQAGVPLIDALKSLVEVTPTVAYRKFYQHLLDHITVGDSFSKSFASIPGSAAILPLSMQQLIITGERTGSLAKIMLKVAEIYEHQANDTAQKLPVILEPMLLLFIGGLVGTIAFAIIIPIYSIVGNVSNK